MTDHVFLTDTRKEVLKNYDSSDSNHRAHKSRIKNDARTALLELLALAATEEIDNSDIFEPKQVRALIQTLLTGPGGLDPNEPDTEYTNSLYVELDQALRNYRD